MLDRGSGPHLKHLREAGCQRRRERVPTARRDAAYPRLAGAGTLAVESGAMGAESRA
jgi:hypothetical protein